MTTTIGAKIDALHALREKKRNYEEEVKLVQQQMDQLEFDLIEQMDASGVTNATGGKASVSVGTSVKPSVENWDDFYAFIARHKYYHLLERRPSVTGCRELFEQKGNIPGVVPYTQRKLNLRST